MKKLGIDKYVHIFGGCSSKGGISNSDTGTQPTSFEVLPAGHNFQANIFSH